MRGFSKATIAGNLTRDPELRALPSGTSVCSFTVAVNRMRKDANGELQEQASFLDCSAWGRQGETISQYLKKGDPILLDGRIEQHSWDDKTTGQKRSRVEIIVDDFIFLGKGDGGNGSGRGSAGASTSGSADVVPDEVPEDSSIDLSEVPF